MQNHVFKLQASKLHGFLIVITIFTTILIWLCLSLSLVLKIAGIIFLLAYGIHLFRNRQPIKTIKYNGEWSIERNNILTEASLQGDSIVTGYVSILRFRIVGSRRTLSCVIFRDALQMDEYRQLLVILRMT
jgi:hypothetical protein